MEIWFDGQTAGMIGGWLGTCVGICGGIVGTIGSLCICKGWKRLFYSIYGIVILFSVILLGIGLAALAVKQPYHVWYCFLLPGGLGTLIFSGLFPFARRRIAEYELRKSQAKDL
jgi:hypothetical protein